MNNVSLQSRIIFYILRVFNFKKRVEQRISKGVSRTRKEFVPRSIKRSYPVNIQTNNSKQIATFEKKETVTRNHIIFFHGGAYIFEATPGHWRLAEELVKMNHCRMTLVEYPLAPEHNYKETFISISSAYEKLKNQYPDDNFILMGDSAGGGLALAFAQKLIEEKRKRPPAKIILLSPWLDLTMSNPDISNNEDSDYMLTVKMLKDAGMKYSDGDDQNQYLLSPINGNLKDIPTTIVFYGTEELFYADCIKFKSMLGSNTQNVIFREYRKMQHDWAIFPIPESKQVVNDISKFIDDARIPS